MTLGLDTHGIASAVYNRLAVGSDGAQARAAIGSSSAMIPISGSTLAIFDIDELSRVAQAHVPFVWAGFERGSATGQGRTDMRNLPFDWWFYAAPDHHGKYLLEGLVPLIDALYKRTLLANGRISCDLITKPTLTLTWYAMRARLFYSTFV